MHRHNYLLTAIIASLLWVIALPGGRVSAGSDGIDIFRPAYGEIDVVIERGALDASLSKYASVALRSFDNRELYVKAVDQLRGGTTNQSLFLLKYKLKAMGTGDDADSRKSWYNYKLVPNGSTLLSGDSPASFYYMLVFFDASGKLLGFRHDALGSYQPKLSSTPTIVALMYHHFTTDKSKTSSVVVHRDEFRSQLRALKAAGFAAIRQQDLLAFLKGDQRVKLPEKSVLITIDDGYESSFDLAYPVLLQERVYASLFAVTSYRGQTLGAIPHFSWEQASEMYQSGFIDIQSHTDNLHYYGKTQWGAKPALTYALQINGKPENKFAYEKRIYDDLRKSRSLIEQHVGNKVFALSYPFGSYNSTVINRATAARYSLMYTVTPGIIQKSSNPAKLPRINVDGKDTAKALLDKIRAEMEK